MCVWAGWGVWAAVEMGRVKFTYQGVKMRCHVSRCICEFGFQRDTELELWTQGPANTEVILQVWDLMTSSKE